MPLVTFPTLADYQAAYRVPLPDGSVGHFERRWYFEDQYRPQWERIAVRSAWAKASTILVVGCGYGWGVEVLRGLGYTNAWGTDISPHIQATKALESNVPTRVLADDVLTAAGRTAVATATGVSKWNVIVTEDMLTCYSDSEVTSIQTTLRGMLAAKGVLLHILSTTDGSYPSDPRFNWKPGAAWRALLGLSDGIVRVGGMEVY